MTIAASAEIFVVAVITGALITSAAVSWTAHRGILDHPNERSSHATPTPRGGGIAIVVATLMAELIAWRTGFIDAHTCVALAVGGALVAAIGAWDDVRSISARARLPVQLLAAVIAVVSLGASANTPTIGTILLAAFAAVGIVWMTNLYNFMDGIDGIAGAQGVAAGIGAAALLVPLGSAGLAAIALAVAGACAGFLTRNWSPARIFMGDVGSGFLGFTFGVLVWASVRAVGLAGYVLLLPLLPFILDATVTLFRRAARRADVTTPHREHLYQRAVIAGVPHAVVAAGYGIAAAILAVVGYASVRLPVARATTVVGVSVVVLALAYAAATMLVQKRGSRIDG